MAGGGKRVIGAAIGLLAGVAIVVALFFGVRGIAYRRPQRGIAEQSGAEPALIYAIIKAESGFDETAESRAGAVGLMQLMPATAEFICRREGIAFEPARLKEGAYNVRLGCLYLCYLMERFGEETAVAAYNAGEGTVSEWLQDRRFSADGRTLSAIPYPETARYVKKVMKLRKIYRFFYH